MAKPGAGLAARFRRAVATEADAQRARKEAEQRRRDAARAARDELLRDLAEFGRELGFPTVHVATDLVKLTHDGHRLELKAEGDEEIHVDFEGKGDAPFRLYREPQLADKWVLSFRRRGQEHRLLLFDQGLEELLVLGLRLPRPDPDAT